MLGHLCTIVRMAVDYFAGDPRTNAERMLAGDLYVAEDPEIERRAARAVRLSTRYRRAVEDGEPDAREHLAKPRRAKLEAAKPITIGDNVWLGGGVIVCPGVTIGDNAVIGAGAVVTRDVPADVVAVGNPARVVRRI